MRITNICHISTVHGRYDTRIFHKECVSLASTGYDVILLVADGLPDELIEGVKIKSISQKIKSKYRRIMWLPIKMFFAVMKERSKIVHFHDPELLCVGMVLKIFGKKVIYDAHEDVVQTIREKKWIPTKILREILSMFVRLANILSARVFFNLIITATDTINTTFPQKNIVTINNYPIISKLSADIKKTETNEPIIIYAGGLTEIRGIRELIQALHFVKSPCVLHLLGNWDSDNYKKACMAENGWVKVRYFGFLSLEETYVYLQQAMIGIVNFLPLPNHIHSRPNKVFEYIACAKPVVISHFESWKTLFSDCALFVDPQKPQEIAEAIDRLLIDSDLRSRLGEIGKKKVLEHYSWESEENKLLTLYSTLT